MTQISFRIGLVAAFAACLASACLGDEYEESEDISVDVDHPRIAVGASGHLILEVRADEFLQTPHAANIDSIDVSGPGKIAIDRSSGQESWLDFEALEPGPVEVRVSISQNIDRMFGTDTRYIYDTVEFEVVEPGEVTVTDPCVVDGATRPRLFRADQAFFLDLEVADPSGRPWGGRDAHNAWVRDATGTVVPAILRARDGRGALTVYLGRLTPGALTIGSEHYGFEVDTVVHSRGEVDRLEVEEVTSLTGNFYDVSFNFFMGETPLCEEDLFAGVTGRTLTPEVCVFSGIGTDTHLEQSSSYPFELYRKEDGLCRLELLAPWANEGEGLEEIVEFEVRAR
ncbi:hypothetical protein FIV42_19245 [Persicimonas caeni]|uniref:DUF4382 domain-containing protein n=1 Tax=Persicimonas caeni TaxID=2292766 RepID=A0A4Y6PWU0_PERCE|nr:hypothetical protein [Persicimonas caeni]QDG52801.1 hypothetical protein FIV42_19245 [Persicimonas caeni]QED34023.1 hypothetical protein FRD00_19240 [Persicimonas caeni]